MITQCNYLLLKKVLFKFILFLLLGLSYQELLSQTFPGGFIEKSGSKNTRPRLTSEEIGKMLPERGAFTFPPPYNTTGIRVTNASDCGGKDCVNNVGYSYWRNTNNHIGSDTMLIFVGLDRVRGGPGPTLFSYNKKTDYVRNLGPIFSQSDPLSWVPAIDWYFSGTSPTKLYAPYISFLYRIDVKTREKTIVFDANRIKRGYRLKQAHSSNDDHVHCFTITETNGNAVGSVVYNELLDKYKFFPISNSRGYDESNIDKSGNYFIILDNVDGKFGADNVIYNVTTEKTDILYDEKGNAGHLDMGYGVMAGEDNYGPEPGAVKMWDLTDPSKKGVVIYHDDSWTASILTTHVSYCNAQPVEIKPLNHQYVAISRVGNINGPRFNEIFCIRMDNSLDVLVVAPVMTNLSASGGEIGIGYHPNVYNKFPKGNLDITGKYFIWTDNMNSSRMDMFIVKVPSHLLVPDSFAESLPVQLFNFIGKADKEYNGLFWETGYESNNRGFEVERKYKNQSNYTKIGFVSSKSDQQSISNKYEFTDPSLDLKEEYAIYRLKQISTDGKIHYSSNVIINRRQIEKVVEYIILENEKLFVRLNNRSRKFTLRLFDSNGKLLVQKKITSDIEEINVGHFPKQIMVIDILGDDGTRFVQKIFH